MSESQTESARFRQPRTFVREIRSTMEEEGVHINRCCAVALAVFFFPLGALIFCPCSQVKRRSKQITVVEEVAPLLSSKAELHI